MAVFDYQRTTPTMEINGSTYTLPVKTATFADKIAGIQKRTAAAKSNAEGIEITVEGIGLFIGTEAAAELFPCPAEADSDEVSALWFALNAESNRATQAVIDKYKPQRDKAALEQLLRGKH